MKTTIKELRQIIKEEYNKQLLREQDIDVPIPQSVNMRMSKFIQAVDNANLNRQRKLSILDQVIKALGIEKRQLGMFTQKIKKGLE